jgi:cytochrome P450
MPTSNRGSSTGTRSPAGTARFGIHYCLGANLARLEGRVALDELLDRFPEWDVDTDGCALAPTSTVRGWERLPILLPRQH